jgi:hypothetical protein
MGTPNIVLSPDGMFKRQEYMDEDVARIREKIDSDPASVDLEEYQFWTQDSWKASHGSWEATERFADKLVEEHEELSVAMYGVLRDTRNREARIKDLVSEAGDVLWCLNALISNMSGNLRNGLQRYLYEASMGTLVYDYDSENQRSLLRHPVWRDQALQVATSNLGDLTYGHIDDLLRAKFMPNPSVAMNIGSEDECLTDPAEIMSSYDISKMEAVALQVTAKRQYNYGEDPSEGNGLYHSADSYMHISHEASKMAGKMVLDVGFVLHALAGATLGDAIRSNYTKITARVQANRVDRGDGVRTEDLL